MARKIEVELVGDSRSLERAFSRSARSAKQFDRSIASTSRSITRGFGAIAAAVGVTAGAAGLVRVLKSSVDAAKEAQVAQGQLQNALKNVGVSFDQNRTAIEARTKALSAMSGFDDELITQTFTSLIRTTGDVTEAMDLNALAIDVARGRNISLLSATQLVTKASLGMAGALRRVGIAASTDATAIELLELLNRKFAGSAEAYGKTAAGAQDRFNVALENAQEIIGAALLPSITDYLDKLTAWLNDTKNQERLQKRVNDSVSAGEKVLRGIGAAIDFTTDKVKGYNAAWDDAYTASKEDFSPFSSQNQFAIDAQADALNRVAAAARGYGAALRAVSTDIEALRNAQPVGARTGVFNAPMPSGQTFIGRPLTEGERLRAAVSAASLTPGTGDDVAALRALRAKKQAALDFALKMIDEERGNTRVFAQQQETLSAEIASANARLEGIAKENAAKTRGQKQEAVKRDKAGVLAWLDFAAERADATKGTGDNRRVLHAREKRLLEIIRSEGRTLDRVRDLWRTRKQIRDLNKSKAREGDPLAGLMQVSSKRMVQMLAAGTGLGVAGRHRLSANVAGMELRPINVGVHIDGREVGRATTKDNARTSRRTSRQTSGYRG